ncbi:MAG: hypothetical protein HC778_06020 [Chamaesiphon sp. CSU_1_12]|nr:hypothetical protein [Chamaesiphon sp. CSU_1_12]
MFPAGYERPSMSAARFSSRPDSASRQDSGEWGRLYLKSARLRNWRFGGMLQPMRRQFGNSSEIIAIEREALLESVLSIGLSCACDY